MSVTVDGRALPGSGDESLTRRCLGFLIQKQILGAVRHGNRAVSDSCLQRALLRLSLIMWKGDRDRIPGPPRQSVRSKSGYSGAWGGVLNRAELHCMDAEARPGPLKVRGEAPGKGIASPSPANHHISPHKLKTWNRNNYLSNNCHNTSHASLYCKCTHADPTHPIARSNLDFAPSPWIPSKKKRKRCPKRAPPNRPKRKRRKNERTAVAHHIARSARRPNFLTPSLHHLAVPYHQTPVPASPRRHPMRHGQRASPRDDRATWRRRG